jgi:hypothetical protein
MRQIVAMFVLASCLGPHAVAQPATGAAGKVRACVLLTRELVTQVTPYEKEALKLVMGVPAQGDTLGPSGSECTYGGITLQIDPFGSPERTEQEIAKTWAPVLGLGDAAYFRDNRGEWAELYVRAGARVLTIQMDAPNGKTPESIRSNVMALAKALLPGLK